MQSDLQRTVIELLLCSYTVVVGVDVNMLHGVYPIIQRKEKFDAFYYTLFDELRDDAKKVLNYFRMSISSFNGLHRRLMESLQLRNSKMRNCIQPAVMLAVAVR